MPRAQRILTVMAWAAPAVGLLAFFLWAGGAFEGLGWDAWNTAVNVLWAFIGGSVVVGFVSSLVAFGLSLRTRKGRFLAVLPLLGILLFSWFIWEVATHLPVA